MRGPHLCKPVLATPQQVPAQILFSEGLFLVPLSWLGVQKSPSIQGSVRESACTHSRQGGRALHRAVTAVQRAGEQPQLPRNPRIWSALPHIGVLAVVHDSAQISAILLSKVWIVSKESGIAIFWGCQGALGCSDEREDDPRVLRSCVCVYVACCPCLCRKRYERYDSRCAPCCIFLSGLPPLCCFLRRFFAGQFAPLSSSQQRVVESKGKSRTQCNSMRPCLYVAAHTKSPLAPLSCSELRAPPPPPPPPRLVVGLMLVDPGGGKEPQPL